MEKLCICDHKDKNCIKSCEHYEPHYRLFDVYNNKEGFCDKIPGKCGFKPDRPECICVKVK